MKRISSFITIFFLAGLIQFSMTDFTNAAEEPEAPAFMVSGLVLQMLTFEKTLMATNGDVSIHVIGSSAVADELKKSIGSSIANCKLTSVTSSNDVPTEKVSVLVIADTKKAEKAIAYTRAQHIISITNKPELVKKGVSLGIGMNDTGGQSLTVNMAASKAEGLNWKPAILKIAKAVK